MAKWSEMIMLCEILDEFSISLRERLGWNMTVSILPRTLLVE
jgi:hypothetical protein